MSEPHDLAGKARAELSGMAKQGFAHPSTRPVLTGAAIGAVAGLLLPVVTLPIGIVAGTGIAFWNRVRR